MKKMLHKLVSTLLIIPLIWIVFIFGQLSLMEGYNIFKPYIDTEFAENYTPELFKAITYQTDMDKVLLIIGEPLYISQDTINGKIQLEYSYTNDGFFMKNKESKIPFTGDFAWYRSIIIFDENGKILNIDKGWSFD